MDRKANLELIRPYAKNIAPRALSACSSRAARQLISYQQAQKLKILPLGIIQTFESEILTIACHNVADRELIKAVRFTSGREVKAVEVDRGCLEEAIFCAYHGDDLELSNRVTKLHTDRSSVPVHAAQVLKTPLLRDLSDGPAGLLQKVVDYAIAKQASDIHLTPRLEQTELSLRINGELRRFNQALCPPSDHQQLVSRVKVLAGLDSAKKNLPQDGAFDATFGSVPQRIRVSTFPTIHGEKVVLRLMPGNRFRSLNQIEFSPAARFFLDRALERREGAILVSGPTGSGKSTVLYALCHALSQKNLNCVSLEDPVEVHIDGITQSSISDTHGLTYTEGLRSLLRQDPDVILLGEIRDSESAVATVDAALTGHIVLSTVHARSPLEIILRLNNFGVSNLNIAQGVNLALNLRLLPKLCNACRIIDLQASNYMGYGVHREVGCSKCDYSGFSSRVLIAECLHVSKEVAELISAGRVNELQALSELPASDVLPLSSDLEKQLRVGNLNFKQYCQQVETK